MSFFPLYALPNDALLQNELKQKAEAFINATQQPDTSIKDIDYFISFLSDDFIDEHIKFKVTVTNKGKFRKVMIEKMKNEIFFSDINIE